ncbi:hypothetical protein ACLESO_07665 [Pyxidicoccus sp. 3LG]
MSSISSRRPWPAANWDMPVTSWKGQLPAMLPSRGSSVSMMNSRPKPVVGASSSSNGSDNPSLTTSVRSGRRMMRQPWRRLGQRGPPMNAGLMIGVRMSPSSSPRVP